VFERSAFLYIVVQTVGAIVGAALLKGLLPDYGSSVDVVCTPKPSDGVHRGGKRIYLMSLATQVVLKRDILCSKFDKNCFLTGLRPGPLGNLTALPRLHN